MCFLNQYKYTTICKTFAFVIKKKKQNLFPITDNKK